MGVEVASGLLSVKIARVFAKEILLAQTTRHRTGGGTSPGKKIRQSSVALPQSPHSLPYSVSAQIVIRHVTAHSHRDMAMRFLARIDRGRMQQCSRLLTDAQWKKLETLYAQNRVTGQTGPCTRLSASRYKNGTQNTGCSFDPRFWKKPTSASFSALAAASASDT